MISIDVNYFKSVILKKEGYTYKYNCYKDPQIQSV